MSYDDSGIGGDTAGHGVGGDVGQGMSDPGGGETQGQAAGDISGDPFGRGSTLGGGLYMDRDQATAEANKETVPGFGLTQGRGFLGFREAAEPVPGVPGAFEAKASFNLGSLAADLLGAVVSFALGGPVGLVGGYLAQQTAEVALNPGFTAQDALAVNFGGFPSMLSAGVAADPDSLVGGGAGDTLGGGWSSEPGFGGGLGQSPYAGSNSAVSIPDGGSLDGNTSSPGLFDLDDTARTVAAPGAALAPKSRLPEIILAGAALFEIFA